MIVTSAAKVATHAVAVSGAETQPTPRAYRLVGLTIEAVGSADVNDR